MSQKKCTFATQKQISMEDNFGIQLFEGKKVRFVWDEEQEKYFFSVIDVVQILTDSADINQYVKRMRARDPELNVKWGTICTPVEMLAPDGPTNFATHPRCAQHVGQDLAYHPV